MMPLKLNLLPPAKRNGFLNLAKYLFIREMLELAIFTLAILSIMYLFAWWVVTQAMTDVVTSSLLVNKEPPPVNKEVRELNRLTKAIIASGQDFYPLTPKLMEIVSTLPPTVKLIGVNIDRTNSSVTISGTAATRDALLEYQKVIEDIAWIKGITAPTSQLFQKENINFEIHGQLFGIPAVKKN